MLTWFAQISLGGRGWGSCNRFWCCLPFRFCWLRMLASWEWNLAWCCCSFRRMRLIAGQNCISWVDQGCWSRFGCGSSSRLQPELAVLTFLQVKAWLLIISWPFLSSFLLLILQFYLKIASVFQARIRILLILLSIDYCIRSMKQFFIIFS